LFQIVALRATAFDSGLRKKQTARSATLRVQKPICSGRVCPRSSASRKILRRIYEMQYLVKRSKIRRREKR
jgi:hypothetical protein